MKEESITIESNCDKLNLDVKLFIPNGDIKGIIQFSHGMIEHKEYYYDFMKFYTNKGYVTIINDHRGHGKSVKSIDDLGYFYDEKANYVVEDLHQITLYIKERFPNKKIILFGHSMGSLIVRKYLKKYDSSIDKLIICGSPSINYFSKIGLLLCKIVKRIKGDRYRSKFLNKIALGSNNNNWISNNEEYLKRYASDKLCGYIFTTNGFINLTTLVNEVYQNNYNVTNKNLEILFIAGENDIVIKNKKRYIKSINHLKSVGYNNIKYKLYENMKHAIMFENNNENVYKDVLAFIEK